MSTPFPSRSEMIGGKKKSKKKKTIIENVPSQDEGDIPDGTSTCPIYVSDFEDSSEVAVMGNYKYQDFVTKSLPVVARGRPQEPRPIIEPIVVDKPDEDQVLIIEEPKKANKKKKRFDMKGRIARLSRSKSREKKRERIHIDVTSLSLEDEKELEEITLKGRRSGLISGTPEKAAYDIENGKRKKGLNLKKIKWGKMTSKKEKYTPRAHENDDFFDEDEKSWLAGTLTNKSPSERRRKAKQTMAIKMIVAVMLLLSVVLVSVGISKGKKKTPPSPGKVLSKKEKEIQDILARITGEKTLIESGTPQNHARNWLLTQDKQTLNSDVGTSQAAIIQRYALASFYFATNGDGAQNTWEKNTWLKGPECGDEKNEAWAGIACNSDGEVRAIALDGFGLSGTIPAEVGHLYKLESLILKNNPELTGWVPVSLSHLANLRQLALYNNNLSGVIPDIFEHTKSLKFINLEKNDLHGSIPLEISNLENLETLVLKDNRMEGIVPFRQLASTNIKYLGLSNNRFASRIEREIGSVDTLEYIYLDNNSLRGTIPTHIGRLSNLKALDLGNNAFTGFFPGTSGNLQKLEYLSLNNNKLNRHLPLRISLLSNLSRYFYLILEVYNP